jgi:Family of unknown function (DUF6545)
MSRERRIPRSAMADPVAGLADAVPVGEKFWRHVRRESHRAIELVPVDTEPGGPSGMWCRTAETDYLYYERQTSPFHQAHILRHLAARLLLNNQSGLTLDPALVPDLSPRLVRLILGDDVQVSQADAAAENLAIVSLERTNRRPSRVKARRMLRQLAPLRAALLAAVPEAARVTVQTAPRPRLNQVVVEIRDAVLALRPYFDDQVVRRARQEADVAGLTGKARACSVEAAVLAAALRAKAAGVPAPGATPTYGWQYMPGRGLPSEAAWLVRVSRRFTQHLAAAEPAPDTPWTVEGTTAGRWFTSAGVVALGSRFSP